MTVGNMYSQDRQEQLNQSKESRTASTSHATHLAVHQKWRADYPRFRTLARWNAKRYRRPTHYAPHRPHACLVRKQSPSHSHELVNEHETYILYTL